MTSLARLYTHLFHSRRTCLIRTRVPAGTRFHCSVFRLVFCHVVAVDDSIALCTQYAYQYIDPKYIVYHRCCGDMRRRKQARPGLFSVKRPIAPSTNTESTYSQSVACAICAARTPILRNLAPVETRRCWESRTQHSSANADRAYRTAARLTITPFATSCYHSSRGSTYALRSSRNQGIAPCALCLRKGWDSICLCYVAYTVAHPG